MTTPESIEDDPPLQLTFTHVHKGAAEFEQTLRHTAEESLSRQNVNRATINIAIVSDEEIARLNERHLNHQGPTDVLSFKLSEETDANLEGELVVSYDTAFREAHSRKHSVEAELSLYITHGLLHLMGYDDATDQQAGEMHDIEDEILASVGMKDVYRSTDKSGTS